MRRLCFGGSFNPIHHGHLIGARAVAEAAGFDRVVLFPSAFPPHKLGASHLASAEHRLAMLQRVVPLGIIETSHVVGSVIGALLLLLSQK